MGLILVIAKTGKEKRVAVDLEDALFHLDSNVKAWFTGFPGVLLVELRGDSVRAVEVLERFHVKDVLKIRPFLKVLKAREVAFLCDAIGGLISGDSVGVRVYVRGRVLDKEYVEKLVFSCLEKLRVKPVFASDNFLTVDVIEDIIGISLVNKKNA